MNPMKIQHGGDHYKSLVIEPFELSMANRYDSSVHTIIKYVTRHKDKNGNEDLRKAAHVVDIRQSMMELYGTPHRATHRILISNYISKNQIPSAEGRIIALLHTWACFSPDENMTTSRRFAKQITDEIYALIEDNT